ncbi:MAG TPA: Mur ligase domain-containing protein [Clostridia bacterium]|nr:Mur ligase domain-containing protein [Clostridia bacterium]
MTDLLRPGTAFLLVGICGAGMSSLAMLLHSIGMDVRGSDVMSETAEAGRLTSLGIPVTSEGEAASSIRAPDVIVRSSAIQPGNPVLVAAQTTGCVVLHRTDVLRAIASDYYLIAVSGTHGKTTTTGMIGYALAERGFAPTICVGGHIAGFDQMFPLKGTQQRRIGGRPIMVLETDESDASFLKFHPDVAVMTNIDRDHLGTYEGKFSNLVDAFARFSRQCAEKGGLTVGCGDDKEVAGIVGSLPRYVLYGQGAENQVHMEYDLLTNTATVSRDGIEQPFVMERGDEKSYLNAVAACLACEAVGLALPDALHVLERFPGMERRMQVLADDGQIAVLTDHADHPTEIRATLRAVAARYPGRPLTLVLQPHRFSRVAMCLDGYGPALAGTSKIVLLDIFPAGETVERPAELNQRLRESVESSAGASLAPRTPVDQILEDLQMTTTPGDVVLFMGPGDVNRLGLRFCGLLTGSNSV